MPNLLFLLNSCQTLLLINSCQKCQSFAKFMPNLTFLLNSSLYWSVCKRHATNLRFWESLFQTSFIRHITGTILLSDMTFPSQLTFFKQLHQLPGVNKFHTMSISYVPHELVSVIHWDNLQTTKQHKIHI